MLLIWFAFYNFTKYVDHRDYCTLTVSYLVVILRVNYASVSGLVNFDILSVLARSAGNERSRMTQIISTNIHKLTQNGNS